jgi:hypothetical protein
MNYLSFTEKISSYTLYSRRLQEILITTDPIANTYTFQIISDITITGRRTA